VKGKTGFLLALPALTILFLLFLYPIFFNFYMSFYKLDLYTSQTPIFIGFDNYIFLFYDPVFWNAFYNTIFFTIFSVALEFIIGFFCALLLSKLKRVWMNFLTAICLIPLFLSEVTEGLIGQFMFSTQIGLINALCKTFFNTYIPFLSDKNLAMWTIILTDTWKMFPFFLIIFLAAIISIPSDIVEAMNLDGASQLLLIRYLIIPYMLPVFSVSITIRTIDAFTKIFGVVYIMTAGGPGLATDVIPLRIFTWALRAFSWGKAACAGVYVFFTSIVLIILYLYVSRRR